jgi:hypothetical protein
MLFPDVLVRGSLGPNGLHRYLQKLPMKASENITDVFSQPSVQHYVAKASLGSKWHLYYGALRTKFPCVQRGGPCGASRNRRLKVVGFLSTLTKSVYWTPPPGN